LRNISVKHEKRNKAMTFALDPSYTEQTEVCYTCARCHVCAWQDGDHDYYCSRGRKHPTNIFDFPKWGAGRRVSPWGHCKHWTKNPERET
jgi:hypothetical protein